MTAFELEMARAARFIEAQPKSDRCGVYLSRLTNGSCTAHAHYPVSAGLIRYSDGRGARLEDALCELLDRVEGRS